MAGEHGGEVGLMRTLDEIALHYGTDKASNSHNYVALYEQYLEPLREQPISLLELGWGGSGFTRVDAPAEGGASARMWREYLPNATVTVIDNQEKSNIPDGINFHCGDQADQAFINSLARSYGPFDVVVDDASHLSSKTIRSWELLYPHLAPGALYVVEDTHMAYHDHYYGQGEANSNPEMPTLSGAPTAIQYFKRLVDDVNFHADGVLFPAKYHLGYRLDWITFYFNILFVRVSR